MAKQLTKTSMIFPSELEAVFAQVNTAEAARKQVKDTLRETRWAISQAEQEVQAATQRFGTAAAKAKLNGTAGASHSEAAAALRTAKDQIELLRAQADGLERELPAAEDEFLKAAAAMSGPRRRFIQAQLEAFQPEYEKACRDLFAIMCRGAAMAEGLGVQLHGLALTKIFNLNGDHEVLRLETPTYQGGGYGIQTSWQNDPAAKAVFEAIAPVKRLDEWLSVEANGIRNRRESEQERAERVSNSKPHVMGGGGPIVQIEIEEAA